jgi:NADPH:quinone reductase-like Zn-dependent oxidoreductase
MRTEAVVFDRHGGPEVLERREIEIGDPGPREVRVRVHAVAMNHMDLWVRRGGPAFKLTYPHRLGCDIAGVVDALGPGARGVSSGDRVMVQPGMSCGVCRACLSGRDNFCRSYRMLGENTPGGYSRHIVVPDANVVRIGPDLPFHEAAAMPLCTLTAWQMVQRKAEVTRGQTVLIHAAGSRVIATTGSPEKADRARALGADEVIVTGAQDYVAEAKRLTSRAGADVILDHVGGELFEKSIAAAAWGGRIVTCGATSGFTAKLDLRQIFFRQIEVLGSTMGSKADLLDALPLILDGRLHAVIDRVLPLWDAREAHVALEERRVFGKIVLAVD